MKLFLELFIGKKFEYTFVHFISHRSLYHFWVFYVTKFDPQLNKLHHQTNPNSLDIDLGTVML